MFTHPGTGHTDSQTNTITHNQSTMIWQQTQEQAEAPDWDHMCGNQALIPWDMNSTPNGYDNGHRLTLEKRAGICHLKTLWPYGAQTGYTEAEPGMNCAWLAQTTTSPGIETMWWLCPDMNMCDDHGLWNLPVDKQAPDTKESHKYDLSNHTKWSIAILQYGIANSTHTFWLLSQSLEQHSWVWHTCRCDSGIAVKASRNSRLSSQISNRPWTTQPSTKAC